MSSKPQSYSKDSQVNNLKSRSMMITCIKHPLISWKNLSHSLREMSLNRQIMSLEGRKKIGTWRM